MAKQVMSDEVVNGDVKPVSLDGGLNLKTNPQRLASPATTRADNANYQFAGAVQQMPGVQSQLAGFDQQPLYVYNSGARDPLEPFATGDVLVHAEVAELGGGSNFTYPMVQSSQKAVLSSGAGTLDYGALYPFSVRTRSQGAVGAGLPTGVGGAQAALISVKGDLANDPNPPVGSIWSGTSPSQPPTISISRLSTAVGGSNGSTFASAGGNPVTWIDAGTVPGTNTAYAVSQRSGDTTNFYVEIINLENGTSTSGTTIVGSSANQRSRAFTLFRHANRLLMLYADFNGATTYVFTLRDLVAGTSQTLSGNVATGTGFNTLPLAAWSADPYGLEPAGFSQFTYAYADVTASSVILSHRSGSTVGSISVGTAATLTNTSGTNTSATAVLDTFLTGAYGAGGTPTVVGNTRTVIGTVFRTIWETIGGNSYRTVLAHQIKASVDTGTGARTLTLLNVGEFRDPAGARIRGKAIAVSPAESRLNQVGALQASGVLCPITTGAYGPSNTVGYWAPTYWLIDQEGRIACRWGEAKGPQAIDAQAGTGILGITSYGYSSGYTNTMTSQQHLFEHVLPYWRLADAQFATRQFPATGTAVLSYTDPTPLNATWQPALLTLGFQRQLANPPMVQAGRNTIIGGGALTASHDGRQLVEAGFHVPGPPVFSTDTVTTGFNFFYRAIYKWIDNNGLVHRSQPSIPTLLTSSNATGPTNVTVMNYVNTFRSTLLFSSVPIGTPVTVELYRTVNNATDSAYYFVGSQVMPGRVIYRFGTVASPAAASLLTAFSPTIADAQLVQQPRLYTDADASGYRQYDATPPYPFIWQAVSQGRHFGIACVDGLFRLTYSSAGQGLNAIGIPVEWNFNNYALIPPELGEVRSLAVLDDKVLVLGTRGVGVISGDGPPAGIVASSVTSGNAPAPNTGFSFVTPIPTPAGVLGSGSPVTYPGGVVYQDVQGFMRIDRGLTLDLQVGTPVDLLAGVQPGIPAVVYGRGVLAPALESLIWANPNGTPLVYNYQTNGWSLWPAANGLQTLITRVDGRTFAGVQPVVNGLLTPSNAGGTAKVADFGEIVPNINNNFNVGWAPGTAHQFVLETPWVQLGSGVTGEGLLTEMMLSLLYTAPHTLTVEQAVNYGAYGTPTAQVVTADPAPYIKRFRPTTSRVWSVRYRITITPTTPGSAYSCATISDMLIFTGIKQGLTRVGSGASR